MPAIPAAATEEMTVTLPKELADLVRAEMASGHFATPVEYLTRAVYHEIGDSVLLPVEEQELERWLKAEVPRLCEEADAHPELMLTAEDMYQAIEDELESIRREQ